MVDSPYLVKPGKKIRLKKFDTDDTGKFHAKEDAKSAIEKNLKKLQELQEVLYAQAKHAVKYMLGKLPPHLQRKLCGREFAVEKCFVSVEEACAPDEKMGDHFYTHERYLDMFSRHGFLARHLRDRESEFQSYVLARN